MFTCRIMQTDALLSTCLLNHNDILSRSIAVKICHSLVLCLLTLLSAKEKHIILTKSVRQLFSRHTEIKFLLSC
ncbi:hypothetical protein EVA_14079 [gut metagenome]|uniref:Uncharacterized protein n=1 Tax=gut metagenome TaxID=749906 RepID=J9G7Q5_9ZZZZ